MSHLGIFQSKTSSGWTSRMLPLFLLVSSLLVLTLGACSGSAALEVTDLRANLSLPSETGAVYMAITNRTDRDETLIGAAIPGCTNTEIHEMKMEDGVMRMSEVEGGAVIIPAGETVTLEQGGLHVMCLGKTGSFQAGETVKLTLAFQNAGSMTFDAEVIEPGD